MPEPRARGRHNDFARRAALEATARRWPTWSPRHTAANSTCSSFGRSTGSAARAPSPAVRMGFTY